MDRRKFLTGLVAASAAGIIASPTSATGYLLQDKNTTARTLERLRNKEIITNETIYLDAPLVIEDVIGGGLQGCKLHYKTHDKYGPDQAVVTIKDNGSVKNFMMHGCTVTSDNSSPKYSALGLRFSK